MPELLTQFAPLTAVLSVVERVALSESPVLITGVPRKSESLTLLPEVDGRVKSGAA
jgi:hypothetical protein